MAASVTQKKWDRISSFYKWSNGAAERRWEPWKKEMFSRMGDGNILFLAIGIGEEIRLFPENRRITAIDISPRMLSKAAAKAAHYNGSIRLMQMDARNLSFPSGTFNQVFTACTFCSVPEPVKGLKELYRVLKPGGELLMFEHTGSKHFPFREMLRIMNPIAEMIGPSVTRDTVANVSAAGFSIIGLHNVYLDIVKTISALK
ncbi:MAG: class I SAM-dependent methyltransferase [Deltaproteobacteria bacterium]|nr:class I SAM-dependent methyltransferase [Deltaproteobacteria bacterium]